MNDFFWLIIVVVLLIVGGFLIVLFFYKGNKIIKWYIYCICFIDLFLIVYVFCYYFELDDLLI